jgi:hypothetical protein
MKSWKRLSYSVSIALLVTAMSYLSYSWGGELFAYPGKFIDVCFNFLIFFVAEEQFPDRLNLRVFFNIAFYSVMIFIMLCLRSKVLKSNSSEE